jgi:hypothetical protein
MSRWHNSFLTSELGRSIGQLLSLGLFIPMKGALSIHWVRGWVGIRSILDIVVKKQIPVFAHFQSVTLFY